MKKNVLLVLTVLSMFFIPAGLLTLIVMLPDNKPQIKQRSEEPDGWDMRKIAQRYAPVLLQQQNDRNAALARYDYICAANFDGDWDANNNLANVDADKRGTLLKSVLYYSLMESETHFFISYCVFHPIEWGYNEQKGKKENWYENGMETMQVVVRKKEKNKVDGLVEILALQRANSVEFYRTPSSSIQDKNVKFQEQQLVLSDASGILSKKGTHPLLVIRSGRHTIEVLDKCRGMLLNDRPNKPQLKCGLRYLPGISTEGETPVTDEEGKSKNRQEVVYALKNIEEELWTGSARQQFFKKETFRYQDWLNMVSIANIPKYPAGHLYKKMTTLNLAPFLLGRGMAEKSDGSLFFHPLLVYKSNFLIKDKCSCTYLQYPYAPEDKQNTKKSK